MSGSFTRLACGAIELEEIRPAHQEESDNGSRDERFAEADYGMHKRHPRKNREELIAVPRRRKLKSTRP
jgi:hypothetical protein